MPARDQRRAMRSGSAGIKPRDDRAATQACPVCLTLVPADAGEESGNVPCRRCGWVLFSAWRLGPLTPAVERDFSSRLDAAVRQFDALAVATAAGAGDSAEPAQLRSFAPLARLGPPTESELAQARQAIATRRSLAANQVDTASAAAAQARSAARAVEGAPRATEIVVVELSPDGILARRYGADDLTERAWLQRWTWADVLPGLPKDSGARRYWVAGGVSDRFPPQSAVPAAARRWSRQHASGWPARAVLVAPAGWPVLDAFAAELARHGPVVSGPPGAVRTSAEWARRVTAGVSACGIRARTDAAIHTAGAVPQRAVIAASGSPGEVGIWTIPADPAESADAPQPERVVRLHSKALTAVALAPGATALLAGARDGDVRWSPGGSAAAVRLPAHAGQIMAVRFAAGGLLSLGADGRLHCVPMGGRGPDTGGAVTFQLSESGCSALAGVDGRSVVIAGGIDGVLRIIDLKAGSRLDVAAAGPLVTALAMDDSSGLVVAALGDGTVHLLELESRAWRARWRIGGHQGLEVAISSSGKDSRHLTVVASDARGQIYYWSGRPGSGEETMSELGMHDGGVRGLGLLAGGQVISVGRDDGVARIWSLPEESAAAQRSQR